MSADMRVDMRADMCVDMRVEAHADICVDKFANQLPAALGRCYFANYSFRV